MTSTETHPSEPGPPVREGYRNSLDDSLLDVIAPAALLTGATLLINGIVRQFGSDPDLAALGPPAIGSGLLLLGIAAYARLETTSLSIEAAHLIVALHVAILLLINLLYYRLQPSAQHTLALYIVAVGLGMFPLPHTWFAASMISTVAVWISIVASSESPFAAWADPALSMLAMVAFGITIHVWRYRYAERLDALDFENERNREARTLSERRYRDVTENSNDLIVEVDERGRVLYANPAHQETLGFPPESFIGRTAVFIGLPSLDNPFSFDEFDRMFERGPAQELFDVQHADGSKRTLESNIRPFINALGERHLVVTSRDVTDRLAAERAREEGREHLEVLVEQRSEALRASLKELQRAERLASVGTLAAGIAHQINNPIGSIMLNADFALRSERSDGEREIWREALENNLHQARRCGQIVSSILRFARNEPTEKTQEDLAEIVRNVCRHSEPYAQSRLAVLDASKIEAPLPIHGSAIELEQAILNIVRNATESSPDAVRVSIRAARDGQVAKLIISDDGDGMDGDQVTRAFDPFYTTRLGRGGTGLGLSVAHGIVTDHGGDLSLESKPDVGTTITLTLPIHEPGRAA